MLSGSYNLLLVALSVLLAMGASYVALDFAGRIAAAGGRARWTWLAGGALAQGVGIWNMHFVGMLAFHLHQGGRPVAMTYDVPMLAASALVAMAASAAALALAARPGGSLSLAVGAVARGGAIAGMHYVGMAGLRMPGTVSYDPALVSASVAIAVGASGVATWLVLRFRERDSAAGRERDRAAGGRPGGGRYWIPRQLAAAAVMGLAIAGMHYTAMAATRFEVSGAGAAPAGPLAVSNAVLATDGLATAVVLATAAILTLAVLGSAAARWTQTRLRLLEEQARLYREAEAARSRLAFLGDASRALATSLDPEVTLATTIGLVVPAVADVAVTYLVDPDGAVRRTSVVVADPAHAAIARDLQARPVAIERLRPVLEVLATGRAILHADLPADLLPSLAGDAEHERLMRALGPRSAIAAPLTARGQLLGALLLVTAGSGRRYTEEDLGLVEDLARRAGLAVANARLYAASEQTRVHAEAANRAKDIFLATMSHELRTPLNAIGGYAELLEMGLRGPLTDRQLDDLARIRRSQQHLLTIVNDVLDYARLDAGAVRLRSAEVPLLDVLADVEALVRPQMDVKGLTYAYDRPAPDLAVRADRDALVRVLLSLLSNSMKFSPEGTGVALAWEARGDDVLVRVTDRGIGIPADQLERIFEPFTQVHEGFTRPTEGMGLGLAIGRQLARDMGGALTVASIPGEGATFTLCVPRAGVARDGAAAGRGAAVPDHVPAS
jgi:signal transduction histidine kinase/NO-binding membrane sensor protein with MHYT domain